MSTGANIGRLRGQLWKYGISAQTVDKMMGRPAENILGRHCGKPGHGLFIETPDNALFGN